MDLPTFIKTFFLFLNLLILTLGPLAVARRNIQLRAENQDLLAENAALRRDKDQLEDQLRAANARQSQIQTNRPDPHLIKDHRGFAVRAPALDKRML